MADTPALVALPSQTSSGADRADRLIGILVMAVLPALFWTAIIAAAAPLAGFAPSLKLLAGLALAIAGFLGCVASALRITR